MDELKAYELALRADLDNIILRVEKTRPITLQELSWQESFIEQQLSLHQYYLANPLNY